MLSGAVLLLAAAAAAAVATHAAASAAPSRVVGASMLVRHVEELRAKAEASLDGVSSVSSSSSSPFSAADPNRRQGTSCARLNCNPLGGSCPYGPDGCGTCASDMSSVFFSEVFGPTGLNFSAANATRVCAAWDTFFDCIDTTPGRLCYAYDTYCQVFNDQYPGSDRVTVDCPACQNRGSAVFEGCEIGNICASTNTCQEPSPNGPCTEYYDCGAPLALGDNSGIYTCNLTTGFCETEAASLEVGDYCTSPTKCSSGICQAGVCVGKPAGAQCSGTECLQNHFCSNVTNTCTPSFAVGQACASSFSAYDDYTNVCQLGLECRRRSGVCEAYDAPVAAGDSCYFNSECSYGKFCDASFQCRTSDSVPTPCDPSQPVPAACTQYQESYQSTCSCDYFIGNSVCGRPEFGLPAGCESAWGNMMTCMIANSCTFGTDTCRTACGHLLPCISACYAPQLSYYGSCLPPSFLGNGTCGTASGGGTTANGPPPPSTTGNGPPPPSTTGNGPPPPSTTGNGTPPPSTTGNGTPPPPSTTGTTTAVPSSTGVLSSTGTTTASSSSGGNSANPSTTGCYNGAGGCPCTQGGGCDPGLICDTVNNICYLPAGSSSSNTNGSSTVNAAPATSSPAAALALASLAVAGALMQRQ